MSKAVELKGAAVGYKRRVVLKNIELELGRGEIVSLIGPNGAGKSTLLKTLSGQLALLSGAVLIDGTELSKIEGAELARKEAVVLTDRVRPDLMTCLDVVEAGRYPYTGRLGKLGEEDRRSVREAMELLRVTELADRDFNAVSDGQRQRVLIARAVAQKPEILLLDEPTSYLDIRYRLFLMELLRALAERGMTVVMSLHEIDEALEVSDRVVCVKEGEAVYAGTPEEVLKSGRLKELFDLTDEMYEQVFGSLRLAGHGLDRKEGSSGGCGGTQKGGAVCERDASRTREAYKSFSHTSCEYFPCHKTAYPRDFSCLFCYCPLYFMGNACGGNLRYTAKGIKDCTNCLLPHKRKNYDYVMKKLRDFNAEQQKQHAADQSGKRGADEDDA